MPKTRARNLITPYEDRLPPPGEQKTFAALDTLIRQIQETTARDYGYAPRGVHAKSHAILEGELTVEDNLPPDLAQGLFARPGTHPVLLRFSTNPGDILDDSIAAPRGLAIKVLGVKGERLPGAEGGTTQDFVLVNAPAFAAPDAKTFVGPLKLLAATTDTGQGWKKAVSATLRGVNELAELLSGKPIAKLAALGGHPQTHPLGETYYSATPFRYGNTIAKFSLAPVSPGLVKLGKSRVGTAGRPNALRSALIAFLRDKGGAWEFRVQLRTNPVTMPIENAAIAWPESESPFLPVARLSVKPQPAWSEARAAAVDDRLAFSPWQGLAAHEPLGSINRARRDIYRHSAAFRAEQNGCPITDPGTSFRLPDDQAAEFGTRPGREGRRPGTPDAPRSSRDTTVLVAAGTVGVLAAIAATLFYVRTTRHHRRRRA